MELLLRVLTPRGLLLLAGAAAMLVLGTGLRTFAERHSEARALMRDRQHPVAAPDIVKDLDARASLQLHRLYRDVSREIDAAQSRGHDVRALQSAADAALALDTPASRAYAIANLNRLRLAIPQPFEAVRPFESGDEPSDSPKTPPSRHVRGARWPHRGRGIR